MSDLSDLAEELTKDLPLGARKVIDKAVENGWELNAPGMTVVIRLNHPTDDLAAPLYVCWVAKRTPKGKIGFNFVSASTATMVPMRPADVLEYLEDPTVAYTLAEEAQAEAEAKMNNPPWDDKAELTVNLKRQLGAEIIAIESDFQKPKRETAEDIMKRAQAKMEASASQATASPAAAAQPSPARAPGLRVGF